MDRRRAIRSISRGLAGIALTDMLAAVSRGTEKRGLGLNAALQQHHIQPRANRVIFLFMHGGPSHIDTFDYKPALQDHDGEPLPFAKPRIQFAQTGNLLKSPWKFGVDHKSGSW
jgi:hypothetical protein